MINRLKLWSRQYSLSLCLSLDITQKPEVHISGFVLWALRVVWPFIRSKSCWLLTTAVTNRFCCVHETAPLWLVPQNYSRCLTLYFHFKYKWRTVLFKPRQQLQDQAQITNARSVTGRLILFSQYASAYVAFLAKNQKCILTRWWGCRKFCNVSILISEFLRKPY